MRMCTEGCVVQKKRCLYSCSHCMLDIYNTHQYSIYFGKNVLIIHATLKLIHCSRNNIGFMYNQPI